MIEIKALRKKFGKVQVLDGIDLSIDQGGVLAVLGPNGSGKTTLIKSFLGMVIPDSGDLSFREEAIQGSSAYRDQVNYLPQIADFPANLRVRELIRMIKDLRGRPADDQRYIELFELEAHLDKKLGNLSGGTRQKVNLVLCFMFDSPLWILDEPTTGLDPVSLIKLKGVIADAKAEHKTVLITTHIMSFVEEMADRIVFLLDGKIYFEGTVQELKSSKGQVNLEAAIAELLKEDHA